GVVAVLDRGGAAHDVRALEETELLVIPTDPLHALLERHPILYAHFVKILCYRLRKAYTAVSELALASLRQRVARQLCTLGTPIGGTQARATLSPISLTQEELALRVGATRPSVNRELKEMER